MKESLPTLRTLGPHRPRRNRLFSKLVIVSMLASGGIAGYRQYIAPSSSSLASTLLEEIEPKQGTTLAPQQIEVFFSPNGGCTEAIVAALNNARASVHLQAYSFTSAPIAEALARAKKRGIAVEAVLDKSQDGKGYSSADFIERAGVPTFIDDKHAIAHNKIIVIDQEKVITGSFNFSKAAEVSNAENLLILHSKPLALRYIANWHAHREHSYPYVSGQAESKPSTQQ